ncbi:MAG: phosphoribosyltransferase [Streptomyces sp.]|nr:phosphoribosyltransferase [Streptomyces sp.]
MVLYLDRRDGGRQLARALGETRLPDADVLVLGLPRGGVPVAEEVAQALHAPLDVCLVRKLGVPGRPELAMGAVGEDAVRIVNEDVLRASGVSPDELAEVEARERALLEHRAAEYRENRPPADVRGRTVVLVDDGVATGASARAACQVVRDRGAARVVMAVPVAPADWTARLGDAADVYVCPSEPGDFFGVGQFYTDFSQTGDDEVIACLARAGDRAPDDPGDTSHGGRPVGAGVPCDRAVTVTDGGVRLPGQLTVPRDARAVVVFAHGSGSSRHSTRNRFVAGMLNRAGLGTLLFDLLTPQEAGDRANVFDVNLLAERLGAAVRWLRAQPEALEAGVGLFGASTGAAAALWAAAEPDASVTAIVSRGGRPDLAEPRLAAVAAPTLLIVGGHDPAVLDLNRQAQEQLRCPNDLAVVPGATHLFEEPGTLAEAGRLACEWFTGHLTAAHGGAAPAAGP